MERSWCYGCGERVNLPCRPEKPNVNECTIVVASDAALKERDTVHQLAKIATGLKFSRRKFVLWVEAQIYGFQGSLSSPDGKPFCVNEGAIDEAFPDCFDRRWVSDFFRCAVVPPKQRSSTKTLQRLRLIELALQIAQTQPGPSKPVLQHKSLSPNPPEQLVHPKQMKTERSREDALPQIGATS